MKKGKCQLCHEFKPLVKDGHVWPRFAYKKWISDLQSGGEFYDAGKQRHTNRQYKREWFCLACEKRFAETEASKLCDRVEKQESYSYDCQLLTFATSVSLRTCLKYAEGSPDRVNSAVIKSSRRWRSFLLGRNAKIRPFSQHVFVMSTNHESQAWYKMLGGNVRLRHGLVFSQVGPMLIFGILDRRIVVARDRDIWKKSEIKATGGVLTELAQWKVGTEVPEHLARVLAEEERLIVSRVPAEKHEKRA